MNGFTRQIRIRDGYDYRDDPKEQRGAHGMEIQFILRGPLGAITTAIGTGWMARPLRGSYNRGMGPQNRYDRPGVDGRLSDHFPTSQGIGSHCLEQRREYWFGPQDCDVIGGQCYGDHGYMVGDTFLAKLLGEGQEVAWAFLEELHNDWLVAESVEATS
jgi:hypothetical protein